ncbi:MAG: polyprenyl diphosphate synthase [Candidatus Paceibacterota bacterium]|jgi:undecaprenyl diphosphate synthase
MNKKLSFPKHIAFIPDGNRRWAKKHKLKAWLGHKTGAENFRKLLEVAMEFGVSHISFWGSSQDNLAKRPKEEVEFLLDLFRDKFLSLSKDEKIHEKKVKISVFGSWREQFPLPVRESIEKAIEATKDYGDYHLNFFLAYSGTAEISDAIKAIVRKARTDGSLLIDKNLVKECLYTKELPSVDLMIRTGGEPHLSDGFMMWETANAQLYFSDKLWPDFNKSDFKDAIIDYSKRERRFGK